MNKLSEMKIKNKGDDEDIKEYRQLWVDWIKPFAGCENKNDWAITNGIHDALINQIAYKNKKVDTFYAFTTDYAFYNVILRPYNYKFINPSEITSIKPNSYVIVSQPNHEGGITPWFNSLISHCKNVNTKIFLDCAFYGSTLDTLDTSDSVFDAVAFSLSKNFKLAGIRAGIVFGDNLAETLTRPISTMYRFSYFNTLAVEAAKVILPNFKPTYITEHAKKYQLEYCLANDLRPADIWMWAFDKNNNKICITNHIKDLIQTKLDSQ
jgi:aspartate/methionine/tyrosine aminotransferase